MNDSKYLVDMGEEPGSGGAFTVTATATDGTVEKAVFTGPSAPSRAMAYIESQDDFEKRPPLEYPKHIVRGGRHHLALDKKHEDAIGPETDEDKAAEKASHDHVDGEAKHQSDLRDAHERMKSEHTAADRKPERIREGEDEMNYSERVANWQHERGDKDAAPLPALESVQANGDPVGIHANAGFETDDTEYPTIEGMAEGKDYEGVDNVRSPDGVHSVPGSDEKPRTESEMKPAPDAIPGYPGNAARGTQDEPLVVDPKRNIAAPNNTGNAQRTAAPNFNPTPR